MINNDKYNIIFTVTDRNTLTFYKLFHYQEYTSALKLVSKSKVALMREYSISKELVLKWHDLPNDNLSTQDLQFIANSNFTGTLAEFKNEVNRLVSEYNDNADVDLWKKPKLLMVIKKNKVVDLYRLNNGIDSPAVLVITEKRFASLKPFLPISQIYCHNQELNYSLTKTTEFIELINGTIFNDNAYGAIGRLITEFKASTHGANMFSWREFKSTLFMK